MSTPEQLKLVKDSEKSQQLKDKLDSRESKELVIAFSGPVGCGIKDIVRHTESILRDMGYTPVCIKLSSLMKKAYSLRGLNKIDLSNLEKSKRYDLLQDAGKELREETEDDILAQCAISFISVDRKKRIPTEDDTSDTVPDKTVYLIDQLKRPEEVETLEKVYGRLFFLIGVLCNYNKRKKRLIDEGVPQHHVDKVIYRDLDEHKVSHGQKLEKTLEKADFFIRNEHSVDDIVETELKRFFELVHGKIGITPTQHEHAMYTAHASKAKSACLSRQVGAVITDKNGTVLATGTNDVPKYGGGLYSADDKISDKRCVNLEGGICFNDKHKNKIKENIKEILDSCSHLNINEETASQLANDIAENTRLKNLIEFSRSIHAEMDAIISISRKGGTSSKSAYLYTSTFPCHNCARHIIAAGIDRVYYIQPYSKSLADELHWDSIELDPDEPDENQPNKVLFIHFDGVSPRKYLEFFEARDERKIEGVAIHYSGGSPSKRTKEYLDSYQERESKVVQHIADHLNINPETFGIQED